MANIHIAASGSNTSPYDTWAKAANNTATAWADAITASAAGDDFYIDAAFTETNSTNQTLTFKGTAASPNRVFSCTTITNDAPVTADLGAGATYTITGTITFIITGFVYFYGVTFNIGSGAGATTWTLQNNLTSEIMFDTCQLNLPSTGVQNLNCNGFGNSVAARVTLINTPVKFGGTTASGFVISDTHFIWKNTANAIPTGSQAAIANLFLTTLRPAVIICDGIDFAGGVGIASGKNIIVAAASPLIAQITNCKTLSGAVIAATPTVPGATIDWINVDSSATNYKHGRIAYQGTSTTDITIYNNASDGASTPNRYSEKIVTSSNAKPQSPFEVMLIPIWVAAGTYANSKVFLTSATASLTKADVWAEVQYLGSSYPLGSPATTFGAGVAGSTLPLIPAGTTPGALAAASPAWGTGGVGNDYQLAIPSFTTSADGYIYVFVKVGKASLTVYVDPAITVAA